MRLAALSRWIVSISCSLLSIGLASTAIANEPSRQSTIRPITTEHPNRSQPSHSASAQAAAPLAIAPAKDSRMQSASPPAPVFPRPGIPSAAFTRPVAEPQVTNQTRQALGFYGGYAARSTLNQMPRRAPLQTGAAQPMHRQAKPFNVVHQQPTVSPYMNLYRDEGDDEGAPNYFAFVRPQMEQIEANRLQQREIQKLRGQVQGVSSPMVGSQFQATGMGRASVPARYMDTAQFYGGWRR